MMAAVNGATPTPPHHGVSMHIATAISSTSGLILAGAPDQGIDRGLRNFRGAPLALHVMMRLSPQVADIMINANRNIGPYEGFGVAVWPDEMQGLSGALAGILTGLQHCDTRYLVCVPCDAPDLPPDLVQRLADALLVQQADLAVAVTGDGAERRVHAHFCLMQASLLEHLTHFLRSGGHALDAWQASLKVAEAPFDSPASFHTAP
jgi:molybdopterin-guanine dinucleotide biosynthesis protein A